MAISNETTSEWNSYLLSVNNTINTMWNFILYKDFCDKKVIELIVQQIILLIIKPYVEICSKEKFMEYCESNYTQTSEQQKDVIPKVVSIPVKSENGQSTNDKINVSNIKQIEQFANELKKTAEEIKSGTMTILDIESKMLPLVSNSPKFMSVESIDNIIK